MYTKRKCNIYVLKLYIYILYIIIQGLEYTIRKILLYKKNNLKLDKTNK